ncbi:hypothetical protein SAMN05443247_11215 [Bradyrhizobium erythrophlei]|jgi:hypothetical protein|nr:hypothetical protein SAMN05443247_11215 [Bradyrhizobium erythrophlei]
MLESPLALDPQVRDLMVETKVTCPFLGSLVHQELLSVRGATGNPLASIEDVRRLGNEGGGDLGDLLAFFAAGNHALMRNSSGSALDTPVPAGLFSLELPGSQGSHPGHSGILQGNPMTLGSGRLSREDFDRLAKLAIDNFLKRSDVGKFIAQNLKRDPNSKVVSANVAELMARDLAGVLGAISTALASKLLGSGSDTKDNHRLLEQKLTRLMGENNLVGSAGEFGLLFAFLTHDPNTREIEGEPALALDRVDGMFVQKCLPDGWQTWKKSRVDWVVHTTALLLAAGKEYHQLSAN